MSLIKFRFDPNQSNLALDYIKKNVKVKITNKILIK